MSDAASPVDEILSPETFLTRGLVEAASLICGASGQVANGSPPIVPLLENSSPMDAQSKTAFTNQEQMSQLASPSTATQEAVPPPPSYQTPQIPPETKREKAEKQLKQEEKQRILAVLPAFNTSYVPDAASPSPARKNSVWPFALPPTTSCSLPQEWMPVLARQQTIFLGMGKDGPDMGSVSARLT